MLFLKRSRHLGYPDYVVFYGGSKSVWDAKLDFKPLKYRALYEPSFENKHRWKAGPLTFVDEKQLIRIAEETFKNSTASRHLFPVSQNLLYFILFYFCHAFPLCVWRPYCQVIPRVRRCVVRNFWPWFAEKLFMFCSAKSRKLPFFNEDDCHPTS